MNLLSWNYRGLGNLRIVNALAEVVKKEEPKIVFLMETKSNRDWMVMVKDKCNFKHGLYVDNIGSKGGLAMLWGEEVKLDIQTFSQSHIDCLVDSGAEYGWWHLTGFYCNLETSKRKESWDTMKHLGTTSSLPWLVIGDFNEIMSMSEKEGGSTRPRQQLASFVETINLCGLRDIGFVGPRFTWIYETRDGRQIRERLDRVLANVEWVNLFPRAKLHHLTNSASDHSPLLLHLERRVSKKKMKKLFGFESMWLKEPQCEEIVQKAWSDGVLGQSEFPLVSCLNHCRMQLEVWNKTVFGHMGRKINELQTHLEWLELQPASPGNIQDMRNTRMELNNWHDKEDAMWYQRSRINWFRDGDRNTSYFHAKASARPKKKDFVEHNKNKPLPALMFLSMMMKMRVTESAQKLHLVSPIPVRRNILARGGEGVHLGGE